MSIPSEDILDPMPVCLQLNLDRYQSFAIIYCFRMIIVIAVIKNE